MPSPPPLYVGIDVGTSGCRAIAIDDTGYIHAQARTAMPAPIRSGTAVEQWPQIWWRAFADTLDELLRRVPPERIAALAVDGTSGTLLLSDATGQPLAPALMYNDARAVEEARRIAAVAPRQSAAHGASATLAKLLHLAPRHPAARHALHQADWIVGRLTGRWGISDTNNCLKLGYDAIEQCWPGWLDTLGVPRDWLPQVFTPGTPLAPLTAAMQTRFKLPATTQVAAGTTDSTAAFLATGASQVGEAVTSLGSTLVMKIITERPIFAPEFGVYSQPLGALWLAGGGSNSGGAVLLHYFSPETMAALTSHLCPEHPTGLDYYPLLAPGERFPRNDPQLAPRLQPRPDDDAVFFQGMLEGMAHIEQDGYRRLHELGALYPISVRSAGGGANNPAWTKIRARLLGVPLLDAVQQEAAYGAALLARSAGM